MESLARSSFAAKVKTSQEVGLRRKKSVPQAIFTKKRTAEADTVKSKPNSKVIDRAAEYERRLGFFGGLVGALDFAEVRSQSDAELLYDAKYGKLEGGKMTREQYMALRRKVGGTARDFWKTWIDVQGEYTDKGYVSDEATTVPGLPFLIGTIVALMGTVGYVVSQTS